MDERDFMQFYLEELDAVKQDAFVQNLNVRNIEVHNFRSELPAHIIFTLSFKQFKQLVRRLRQQPQDPKIETRNYFVNVVNLFPIGSVSSVSTDNLNQCIGQFEPMLHRISEQESYYFDLSRICEMDQFIYEKVMCKVPTGSG